MAVSAETLDKVQYYLDESIALSDLVRLDWRRQTDIVQQSFIVARLFADLGESRALLVDGHINQHVKRRALESESVKGFFNRRCHDFGLKGRRIVVFDTVTTRPMGGRGSSRARLHFHGIFELPEGWTRSDLLARLGQVFGNAVVMGQRQFHVSRPDWTEQSSHNGVQAKGPLGKMLYAIKHAGATYRCLDLNDDGKRSRKPPYSRARDNRDAKRLAQGIPSNFNKKVVFADHVSKRHGKEAFEAWIAAEKARQSPPARIAERSRPAA